MDTVQNIANVVVGGSGAVSSPGQSSGADAKVGIKTPGSEAGGPGAHNAAAPPGAATTPGATAASLSGAASASPMDGVGSPAGTRVGSSRRPPRSEFLSRPNWLFTHNENVLFCTALNALRFPDQNNVPRKFIEEWLADRMVTMETQWPAGSRFLSDTIGELENVPSKFEEKRDREIHQRQCEFHKNRKQALHLAQRNYKTARSPEIAEKARQEYEEAKAAADEPVESINVQPPSPQEIALIELQTKIVRRLQGQTDRLGMAEQLANKPYEEPAVEYFKGLQEDVLGAIADKHQEIAEEREKVETKSKQSRKRRRNQVSNGVTMSGSATRVRFTNREIAMLIHWIYTYPKNEWSSRIYEFYIQPGTARSAEHVRDKMRDLITRSRDTERGGLTTMKTRSAGAYFGKASEPIEMLQLAQHDLQDFKYPDGVLDYFPGGRYFDEERAAWVDGILPTEYLARYHEEISRIQRVVRSKVLRTREQGDPLPDATNTGMYDMRLVSPNNPILNSTSNYATDPEFALASRDLHEAFLLQAKRSPDQKDDDVSATDQSNSYITALASAALKNDTNDQYLHLVQEAQDSAHHGDTDHPDSHSVADLDGPKDHKKARLS